MNRKALIFLSSSRFSAFIAAALLVLFFAGASEAQVVWPRMTVSADGTPISYEVFGSADPTLIFVHGWSCDSRYLRKQIGYFSKSHRVVVLDLAGHGHSGMGRKKYTMRSFGEDVKAVAEAVGSNEVILVGHSMGGQVIAEAAALMPERVLGLIGIDTLEDVEYRMTEEELKKWVTPLSENFPAESRKFVDQMFSPGTDKAIREWILSDMSAAPPAVAISAMEEMMRQYINGEAALVFDKVRVPVISVNGDKWPVNMEGNRHRMLFYDTLILKGADHFLMMDRPDEFNAALGKAIKMVLENTPIPCPTTTMPSENNRMKLGDLPTPFSAEQIMKALPQGSWIRLRNEVKGENTDILLRFGNGNSKAVHLETAVSAEDGKPLGEPQHSKPEWKELQSHASFPADNSTIKSAMLKTFKGDLCCWLYEVKEGDTVTRYWFSPDLPGPPVLLEEFKNGELSRRMTMTGRGR